jgi:hypothetical protein
VEGVDALGTGFGSYKGQAALLLPTGPELLGFVLGGTGSRVLGRSIGNGTVGYGDTGPAGNYRQDAFWRYNGVMHDVGAFVSGEPVQSGATDLNATQIVGYATNGGFPWRAIVWDRHDLTHPRTLPTLGGVNAWALRINPRGVIVGYADIPKPPGLGTSEHISHATMWIREVPHDLTPGVQTYVQTYARAINASGTIVGYGVSGAWRWTVNGGSTALGVFPGDAFTYLWDINNGGVAVGGSLISYWSTTYRAIRVTGTTMVDLNTLISAPGWVLNFAVGISENGIIAGHGTLRGVSQDFLLIPVHSRDDRDDRAESR